MSIRSNFNKREITNSSIVISVSKVSRVISNLGPKNLEDMEKEEEDEDNASYI